MSRKIVNGVLGLAVFAMSFILFPIFANARTYYIEDGNCYVEAFQGKQVISQDERHNYEEDYNIIITNRDPSTSTTNRIVVEVDASTEGHVTLKDLNIDTTSSNIHYCVSVANISGLYGEEGVAYLELDGYNRLIGAPAIFVPGMELRITDDDDNGELYASVTSSESVASGIGSRTHLSCGPITITGGTITAIGGESAAAIGPSGEGYCPEIKITGGTVKAIGGPGGGAGIGSPAYARLPFKVTIEGGTVYATGSLEQPDELGGAGIGAGAYISFTLGGEVKISKDSKVYVAGGHNAYAIGKGENVNDGLYSDMLNMSELYTNGCINFYRAGTTVDQMVDGSVSPRETIYGEVDPPATESENILHQSSGDSYEDDFVHQSSGDSYEDDFVPSSSEEFAAFLTENDNTIEEYIKNIEAMKAAGDTKGLNALISKGITLETKQWISFNKKTYSLIEEISDYGVPVTISFIYQGREYNTVIPEKTRVRPTNLCNEEGYCGFLNLIKYYGVKSH